MKKALLTIVVSILCAGCGTTAKFVYPTNTRNLIQLAEQPKYQKEVAVTPFEEMRSDKNECGTYFLYLIPLMPYGYGTYERPDAARMFNTIREFDFDVSEDLAKAAAASIRRSGLFKDCYFTFGEAKSRADLVLTGEVHSTRYQGAIYSYGLSVYGPLLWFFGLPAGSSENRLALSFALKEVKSGETLWQYSYTDQKKITQGLYYLYGHDVKGFAELMEHAMNEALKDMDKALESRYGSKK